MGIHLLFVATQLERRFGVRRSLVVQRKDLDLSPQEGYV
jgi:hypothetical protein